MSKPVLFSSFRPLDRAENIRAAYDAYDGEKKHIMSTAPEYKHEIISGRYDVLVTDDFPYITPGKCIMIWHAIQGGKKIGLDQPNHPYYNQRMSGNMTYIISASSKMIDIWHQCTGVPKERILPLGMPRTDEYTGYQYEYSKTKNYLFVPTFRDKGETPFPDIDWAYIDSKLTNDEVLIIKAHPWQDQCGIDQVTKEICNGMYKHIVIISSATPTAPFLYIADVVITDYSSVMFDAFLLNKPVVLFEKTPGYVSTRGMYFVYPNEYCPFFARTEQGLINGARFRVKHPQLTPTEQQCRDIVADACDGNACERLNKLIHDLNK